MRNIFFILLVIPFLAGCFNNKSEDLSIYSDNGKECIEPQNPYAEGGHYAGFEWAEEKGPTNCDGNSESFIEGCEEYFRELNLYTNCIDKTNK